MSEQHNIITIADPHRDAAIDVLFRSFHDDPTLRWSFDGGREGYGDRLRSYLELGDRWHRGLGHPAIAAVRDGAIVGVAYVMSPDVDTPEDSLEGLIADLREATGDDCAERFLKQNAVVDDASPEVECYLVALVGVIPELQGQGVGSRLVSWSLEQSALHSESEGVLLATGTERNLVFYRRLGFDVVSEVDIDDELHEWIFFAATPSGSNGVFGRPRDGA